MSRVNWRAWRTARCVFCAREAWIRWGWCCSWWPSEEGEVVEIAPHFTWTSNFCARGGRVLRAESWWRVDAEGANISRLV